MPLNASERTPSRRSRLLSKFFDPGADEKERRKSREELVKRGILKKEAVFGNELTDVKRDALKQNLPEFLVRCISRIEELKDAVGIYRINGDAAAVQKIRYSFSFSVKLCSAASYFSFRTRRRSSNNESVVALRLEIDRDNYKSLNSTKDVSLLASTLKLFFRELPDPLISRQARDHLYR